MQASMLNGLALAYIGDAVYELRVRKHFIELGVTKVKELHKKVIQYTSGANQAKVIHYFLENNILSSDEINIFKRGRNSHVHGIRKNIDLQDYLDATGFEALIGYLYLNQQEDRIVDLENIIYTIGKGESL